MSNNNDNISPGTAFFLGAMTMLLGLLVIATLHMMGMNKGIQDTLGCKDYDMNITYECRNP
jgi:hypothetical protein